MEIKIKKLNEKAIIPKYARVGDAGMDVVAVSKRETEKFIEYGTGLAFEYDGIQHSKYNKHFHRKGPIEFVYQTKKDAYKDMVCKNKGVMLIRIPHFVVFDDLEKYIKQKLAKKRLLPSQIANRV